MTRHELMKEIETIEQEIKQLKDKQCTTLICTTNEHQTSLKLQDLIEKRNELQYQLNTL